MIPTPRRHTRCFVLGGFAALFVLGCAHDDVLPSHEVTATCGNGVSAAEAECHVDSPGCVNCQVQPEWTCNATSCTPLCIDGVVGSGSDCADPHRDSTCDLSGYWAVRETDYMRDEVFQQIQVSSNWFLYHVTQTGRDFAIDTSLDCGVHVTGSATIDYPPATKRSLVWLNAQDGTDPARGKRTGTSTATSTGCDITVATWYFVWGATEAYLPTNFASQVQIETLQALPAVTDPVHGNVFPAGATDPTTPGIPGFGVVLTGLVPGLRYSCQRSRTEYATTSSVAAAALSFDLPGQFDAQESVLRVTECGDGCPLLESLAGPIDGMPPRATWQFIGKTLGSERVSPIVAGQPRVDVDVDLQTCANVVALLPHDGTIPQ
jgi:hypothetical protein